MKNEHLEGSLLRRVVGSILSSSLTANEINYFSDELLSREFSLELANALRKSMRVLDAEPTRDFDPLDVEPPWVLNIMERVQKSKFSKRDIIRMLPRGNFGNISEATLQKMSLKQAIFRALDGAPPSIVNNFLRKLDVRSEPDPYLLGIEKNR